MKNIIKKQNFLKILHKERKLELIEPSNEIADSYQTKSDSNLLSSKILLKHNKLEEAVSLAYYSMYHILTSLLYKTGIKSENHSATIIILKTIFGINNKDIAFSKKERIDKQYYTDFHITEQQVSETIRIAEDFIKKLTDFSSKLNNQLIGGYRQKLKELID